MGQTHNEDTDDELVSIIIPTYNDDDYLPRAVGSVLDQEYRPIEILVIDSSCSSVAEELADTHDQVTRLTAPPDGPGAARNVGISAANGEFIAFLDADDEWLEQKLSRQISELNRTESSFAFSEELLTTSDGKTKHLEGITIPDDVAAHEYYFKKGTGIGSRTVVVRRECLLNHQFDEELSAREDPHLWTRILANYDPIKIQEPLAVKNSRSDSLTADLEMVWQSERASVIDLANKFDELNKYRDERLMEADYRYAKRLLKRGQNVEARQILTQICRDNGADIRILALGMITYLPFGYESGVKIMNRIYSILF